MYQFDEQQPCRETEEIERHLLDYLRGHQELQRVAAEVQGYLKSVLSEQAIRYHLVEARAKSFESYEKKSGKVDAQGNPKYTRLPYEIDDCVAVRVIVYTKMDQERVVAEFRQRFIVPEGEDRNPGAERDNWAEPGWGYDSHHFVVAGVADDSVSESSPLGKYLADERRFEIQVRTVASHAWAEYEHDVRYKPERLDRLSEAQQRSVGEYLYKAANARIEMDKFFLEIEELLNAELEAETRIGSAREPQLMLDIVDETLTIDSLRAYLAAAYPARRSSSDAAIKWMINVLKAVQIEDLGQLSRVRAQADSGRISELMEYSDKSTRIRRLDDDLLSVLGDEYVELTRQVADTVSARTRRERYLPLRNRRLKGKLRIYGIKESGVRDTRTTTAGGAILALQRILRDQLGPEAMEIGGFISSDRSKLPRDLQLNQWRFSGGNVVWIPSNFTRAGAETVMRIMVDRLAPGTVSVLRAGDPIFPSEEVEGA